MFDLKEEFEMGGKPETIQFMGTKQTNISFCRLKLVKGLDSCVFIENNKNLSLQKGYCLISSRNQPN